MSDFTPNTSRPPEHQILEPLRAFALSKIYITTIYIIYLEEVTQAMSKFMSQIEVAHTDEPHRRSAIEQVLVCGRKDSLLVMEAPRRCSRKRPSEKDARGLARRRTSARTLGFGPIPRQTDQANDQEACIPADTTSQHNPLKVPKSFVHTPNAPMHLLKRLYGASGALKSGTNPRGEELATCPIVIPKPLKSKLPKPSFAELLHKRWGTT
jgi:hypothetical protein